MTTRNACGLEPSRSGPELSPDRDDLATAIDGVPADVTFVNHCRREIAAAPLLLVAVVLALSLPSCAAAESEEPEPRLPEPRPRVRVPLPRTDAAPAAPDAGVPEDAAMIHVDAAPIAPDAAPAPAFCQYWVSFVDPIQDGRPNPSRSAGYETARVALTAETETGVLNPLYWAEEGMSVHDGIGEAGWIDGDERLIITLLPGTLQVDLYFGQRDGDADGQQGLGTIFYADTEHAQGAVRISRTIGRDTHYAAPEKVSIGAGDLAPWGELADIGVIEIATSNADGNRLLSFYHYSPMHDAYCPPIGWGR